MSSPNQTTFPQMEAAVKLRMAELFDDILDELPDGFFDKFAAEYAQWIDSQIYKFACGQREHGGSILDRDIQFEIEQEIRDLGIYAVAMKCQPRTIHVHI